MAVPLICIAMTNLAWHGKVLHLWCILWFLLPPDGFCKRIFCHKGFPSSPSQNNHQICRGNGNVFVPHGTTQGSFPSYSFEPCKDSFAFAGWMLTWQKLSSTSIHMHKVLLGKFSAADWTLFCYGIRFVWHQSYNGQLFSLWITLSQGFPETDFMRTNKAELRSVGWKSWSLPPFHTRFFTTMEVEKIRE